MRFGTESLYLGTRSRLPLGGRSVHELLKRSAIDIADLTNSAPGIIFNDDGGEFVGLEIERD